MDQSLGTFFSEKVRLYGLKALKVRPKSPPSGIGAWMALPRKAKRCNKQRKQMKFKFGFVPFKAA